MRTAGAGRKADQIPLNQLASPIWSTELQRPFNQNDHLLLEVVEMKRIGGLTGQDLPDARAQAVGAGLPTDKRTALGETFRIAFLVEVGIEDVRHAGPPSEEKEAGQPGLEPGIPGFGDRCLSQF